MSRYLCYQEYLQLGGDLTPEVFDRIEYRAEKIIQARINATITIDEDVKRCVFELINFLNSMTVNGVISDVKTVANDGYSVTVGGNSVFTSKYEDIYGVDGIINTYLRKYLKSRAIGFV